MPEMPLLDNFRPSQNCFVNLHIFISFLNVPSLLFILKTLNKILIFVFPQRELLSLPILEKTCKRLGSILEVRTFSLHVNSCFKAGMFVLTLNVYPHFG